MITFYQFHFRLSTKANFFQCRETCRNYLKISERDVIQIICNLNIYCTNLITLSFGSSTTLTWKSKINYRWSFLTKWIDPCGGIVVEEVINKRCRKEQLKFVVLSCKEDIHFIAKQQNYIFKDLTSTIIFLKIHSIPLLHDTGIHKREEKALYGAWNTRPDQN